MTARGMGPWLSYLLIAVLAFVAAGSAWSQDEAEPKLEALILRAYDVRDLLRRERDYPYGKSGLPTMGEDEGLPGYATDEYDSFSPFRSKPPSEVPTAWQELVDLVQRMLDCDADPQVEPWMDGGGRAQIEPLRGVLLITQTAHGHEKIAELLALLRKHALAAGRMVTVDAKWVAVDEDKVAELLGDPAKAGVPHELKADALDKAGAKVLYRGRTTCLNQQTVYVACGRIQSYIADVEPVVAENTIGVDPTIRAILFGAMLEVRPELAEGGDLVVLDLHSRAHGPGKFRKCPLPDLGRTQGEGNAMKVDIETVDVPVTEFRSTIRVPLGKAVLLGATSAAEVLDGKVLCLVVQVSASK